MKTYVELEDELYERYGDEFDFQEIYGNLQRRVPKDLNLILHYGRPGGFGGVRCDHDFSRKEKDWMVLRIIEFSINAAECLEEIQDPDEHIPFLDDKPFKYYSKSYELDYRGFLEVLHNLRNRFRGIKALDLENYPSWINEWELCLDTDIGERNRYLIDLKSKRMLYDMDGSLTSIYIIIKNLIKRCDEFLERHNADTRDEKIEEGTKEPEQDCSKNNSISQRSSIVKIDEPKLLEMSEDELVKHLGNVIHLENYEDLEQDDEFEVTRHLLWAREVAKLLYVHRTKKHAEEFFFDEDGDEDDSEHGQQTIH